MDSVTIVVTGSAHSRGVDLAINGRHILIPLHKPTVVPASALAVLADAGVPFQVRSAVAESVPESPPAAPKRTKATRNPRATSTSKDIDR